MYHFIVNPASRSGKGKKLWTQTLEPALKRRDISYKVHFSAKPGDLTRIAMELSQNADSPNTHIVVVGGDGTVNETLQGIFSDTNTNAGSNVTISYIPTGSSNDLARDLGFSKKPLEILNHMLEGSQPENMDAGVLSSSNGSRMFAVSCGIGFDAAVCQEANLSKVKKFFNKIGLGKLTYLGIALKQLFAAKAVSCDIYLDDKEPIHLKKFLFIAVMNHRYEGGGFKFCPDAKSGDGLLDLCVVGNLPKLLILFALPTAFFGKHYIFPRIDSYKAARVRIKTSAPLWVHTDGEVIEQNTDITIACAPGQIRLRY